MLKDLLERLVAWRAGKLQHAAEWWTDWLLCLRTGQSWRSVRARRERLFDDPDRPRRRT